MKTVYTPQDGLNYEFQLRWNQAFFPSSNLGFKDAKEFPHKPYDLFDKYHKFEDNMNSTWHPKVNMGAAVAGDGLLTDHGESHVKSVIIHAKEISNVSLLNGYEIFLLLAAIHFHDIGNMSGRDQHEKKIADIMEKMGDALPLDTAEKGLVSEIATAHGGYVSEDQSNKDTIRNISSDDHYGGVVIRPKSLAAILRFADEVSDDLYRSNPNGVHERSDNSIFHAFSSSLEPISIIGETISFHFRIPYDLTQKTFEKGSEKFYLYDEIIDRMTKCMRELEYCKKYANGLIKITTIDVKIDFLDKNSQFQTIKNAGDSFRLTIHGYPNPKTSKLTDYLDAGDEIINKNKALKYVSGESLARAIRTEVKDD
ncbi:MAG: hypothetical protein HDT28_01765 [Clostridiales bacterium]|nr:hypothetical protein [Clostridiales bacterium]